MSGARHPPTASGTAFRLSLFYGAFFCVAGVLLPFWPLWLSSRGLSAAEIGFVMGVTGGVKVLTTPLAAHVADRNGERKRLIVALALASLVTFALLQPLHGLWPIFAVSLIFFGLWPPVMSLTESVTMAAAGPASFDYGRVRMWGSICFILMAVLAGRGLESAPPDAIHTTALACLALTVGACLTLPDRRVTPRRGGRLPIVDTLAFRPLWLTLIACGLIQGSHAVYYAFSTIHWQSIGLSKTTIGALWAEGVVAEILLFSIGGRTVARIGWTRLLVAAGVAAAARWIGTGLSNELPVLIGLQTLHAISFGAAHLAAMHIIVAEVPPDLAATAQSLYSGVVWGLFLGPMLLFAGILYGSFGAESYLFMAAIGLAGAIIARRVVPRAIVQA